MSKRYPIKTLTTLAMAVAISGCASVEKSEQPFIDREAMERRLVELESERKDTLKGRPLVEDIDTPFLGTHETTRISSQEGLPPHLDQHISLFDLRPYTLNEIGGVIADATGMRVRLRGNAEEVTVDNPSNDRSYLNPDDALVATLYAGQTSPRNAYIINHEGLLSELLEKVASRFDVSWEYVNGEIRLYRSNTRIFQVAAMAGNVSSSASLANQSGGGGDGDNYVAATGGLSTSYDSTVNNWVDIETSLSSILEGKGTFTVSPGTASVVVTASRGTMEEVEDYINELNKMFKRQVALNVNVYTLQMTEDDSKGFSLDAAYQSLSKNYNIGIGGMPSPEGLGNQFTANLLESADSRYAGSEALFNALNEWGDVSIVTSASGVVLNGQPFPIQDVSRETYLAATETTIVEGAATTALTPGQVVTGFSMQVMPQILSEDEVILQYAFTLSNLKEIKEISSGGNSIQAPEVDDRSFTQRTLMPLGTTLVLAGYQRDEDSSNRRLGVGGWQRGVNQNKTMVFVTISAARM
ncbi:hypothetical protein VRRI112168_00545 [Vreelandella rituensis]|uniref:Type II/III secretion system secretin-like domain-containing protein n=1 Tax=Vreelandella rituensis TaxID=2282306 RepID=A0A368U9C6_9GAMM|nr:hypothetical protein [Halomonas rituensis]RCV93818.1 hypothetical protein DU506_01280 [Halomonas rituensis]